MLAGYTGHISHFLDTKDLRNNCPLLGKYSHTDSLRSRNTLVSSEFWELTRFWRQGLHLSHVVFSVFFMAPWYLLIIHPNKNKPHKFGTIFAWQHNYNDRQSFRQCASNRNNGCTSGSTLDWTPFAYLSELVSGSSWAIGLSRLTSRERVKLSHCAIEHICTLAVCLE